ncbi:hypothetical protein GQ543_01870 [candidate division WOR-3 bacterium]|nr:hypothetical protein [candidate division WOR-3 bacterium]
MKISKKLYVTNRDDWRAWLEKNHATKKEVWLVYYKKHTGKPRIPYDDAVEEALCYGWIDSTIKRLDNEKYAQKYTPRRAKSIWSRLNIERAKKMINQGKMTKTGLALFKEAGKKKGSKAKVIKKNYAVPADLKRALTRNKKALENFNNFALSYKKIYVFWIIDAKKKETREKRIKRVVKWAAQNKKSGMM